MRNFGARVYSANDTFLNNSSSKRSQIVLGRICDTNIILHLEDVPVIVIMRRAQRLDSYTSTLKRHIF